MAEQDTPDNLLLEKFLPYRLSILANAVSNALAGIYQEKFQITIPEWRAMAILGRHAPMSSFQIAEKGNMDKAKVSRAVARLLDAGLITRETDPKDNRLLILNLSPRGRTIYEEICPLALNWEHSLLDCLDMQDREALDVILEKLQKRVDDLSDGR